MPRSKKPADAQVLKRVTGGRKDKAQRQIALPYPIPENENERLEALYNLAILDTAPDALIDTVTELARKLFDVPIAVVSLVDSDRQWFKSRCGIETDGTPREVAFCNWTLMANDVFVVEDASKTAPFDANPLVTGEPGLRFYAGAPLSLQPGLPLGTLCLLDVKPRTVSAHQRSMLSDLASLVTGQLRLHERTLANAAQAKEIVRQSGLLGQTEELANIGGWEVDIASGARRWSDNMFRIYGLEPQAEPLSLDETFAAFGPEGRGEAERAVAALAAGELPEIYLELPLHLRSGAVRRVRSYGRLATEGGRPVKLFGCIQDITEQWETQQRLWWSGNHDSLTELPNRALFHERLEHALEMARAHDRSVGLLLIDVDDFKEVNDTLGHDAGDVLLRRVAYALSECAPAPATVARLGGDEFAIILPGVRDRGEVQMTAALVTETLREPAILGGREINCRVSIGYALAPDDDSSGAELLKDADIALYAAKQAGRDKSLSYMPHMRAAMETRVNVLKRARDALASDAIVPFYQPKVCLRTGDIEGFEALLRWSVPGNPTPQSPALLKEAFEDPELSVEIGRRMLQKTIRDMQIWRAQGLRFGSVAVNVSHPEIARTSYVERIKSELTKAALPPSCLQIEVTETVFLEGAREAINASLSELDGLGIDVALDDFGTGFASLSHLTQFPVKWLKIDRSFVMDLETNSRSLSIAEAVISLGRSLGIRLVAEGVETPAQARMLAQRGCDLGQGYLFSRPMPGAVVPQFLRTWIHHGFGSIRTVS